MSPSSGLEIFFISKKRKKKIFFFTNLNHACASHIISCISNKCLKRLKYFNSSHIISCTSHKCLKRLKYSNIQTNYSPKTHNDTSLTSILVSWLQCHLPPHKLMHAPSSQHRTTTSFLCVLPSMGLGFWCGTINLK